MLVLLVSLHCIGLALLLLLQEDLSVTEKRAAVRDLYDKIKMAIDDVQYKQEKVKRKDHEGDNVSGIQTDRSSMLRLGCRY
jgi:hypothetical protein